ncbi:CGNR zinc finger domain-containing protein [Gorillibacterium sp. sgz500922]|uniref:CGNR zinc finger domain-containing protein n=1 Tax=Gorillibacterium sp. sgz500922 TaxID=3446694 RepID=UPI003F67F1C8
MGSATNQEAPESLEIVRQFLNTWRIPKQTRIPADSLVTKDDVRCFANQYFTKDLRVEDIEEVRKLREELRLHLGSGDLEFLAKWLEEYPVTLCIRDNQLDYSATDSLCGRIIGMVMRAVSAGIWDRMKACPDCQWVFYDSTRNKGKIWCTMLASSPEGRSCGTIAKVKRWREKQ